MLNRYLSALFVMPNSKYFDFLFPVLSPVTIVIKFCVHYFVYKTCLEIINSIIYVFICFNQLPLKMQ